MAIDTAAKRRTMLHTLPWMGPGVTPDANKAKRWRYSALRTYLVTETPQPLTGISVTLKGFRAESISLDGSGGGET